MNAPLDLVELMDRAFENKRVLADAQINFRMQREHLEKGIFEAQERDGIRISDTGNCVLSLWATVHGKLDIPKSPSLSFFRFWPGQFFGTTFGCLLKAAIEAEHPEWDCVLEPEVKLEGVSGHIDLLIREKESLDAVGVIEIKSNYGTKALEPPHEWSPFQCLQAASYALSKGAPWFIVLTLGAVKQKARQDFYVTADWEFDVRMEMQRLKQALEPFPPAPDAKEKFRCESCLYSRCGLNKNPRRVVIPALMAPDDFEADFTVISQEVRPSERRIAS